MVDEDFPIPIKGSAHCDICVSRKAVKTVGAGVTGSRPQLSLCHSVPYQMYLISLRSH